MLLGVAAFSGPEESKSPCFGMKGSLGFFPSFQLLSVLSFLDFVLFGMLVWIGLSPALRGASTLKKPRGGEIEPVLL